MTTGATTTSRPGISVGSASEFTLFFHVKPGHGEATREAIRALQNTPGYRPGDYNVPIASIHEARFVLFDDDTRLLFATSFDGPWDAYMDDFAASPLGGFHAIFLHTEEYSGLPDVAAVKAFILGAQQIGRWLRPQLFRQCQGTSQGTPRERGLPTGTRRSRRR